MTTNFVHHETKEPRPKITLTEVKSSQVKGIGHDLATNTLAVQFTRGAGSIYHYANVNAEQAVEFITADSIGSHFGKHIKPLAFEKFVPGETE